MSDGLNSNTAMAIDDDFSGSDQIRSEAGNNDKQELNSDGRNRRLCLGLRSNFDEF